MHSIVIIGGGTGTSTLLQGLKKYPLNLSVIVSTADDGGSTGILRRELGVMPPGDIRQCLLALSDASDDVKELFNYRFSEGELQGHNTGNIILAALEKTTGSIEKAINQVAKILDAKGNVFPVSLVPTTLTAILENGSKLIGEHVIDEPRGNLRFKIEDLRLEPSASANSKALAAITHADVIVLGPGDLFTSTLPNLLVKGIANAINKSKAKKVLITNIMTKHGQTDGFKASDFVWQMEKYLGGKLDVVLQNNKKPSIEVIKKYGAEKATFVEPDLKDANGLKVISQNLISSETIKKLRGDKLKRSFLRHDSNKLADLISKLL